MLDYCRPQKPYKWYQIVQYVCGAVHKPMQAYAYPMATSYVMFPTHVQARAQESESTARSVAPPAGHSIASPTRDRRAAAQKLVVAEAAAAAAAGAERQVLIWGNCCGALSYPDASAFTRFRFPLEHLHKAKAGRGHHIELLIIETGTHLTGSTIVGSRIWVILAEQSQSKSKICTGLKPCMWSKRRRVQNWQQLTSSWTS